jgi:hypothetical protein
MLIFTRSSRKKDKNKNIITVPCGSDSLLPLALDDPWLERARGGLGADLVQVRHSRSARGGGRVARSGPRGRGFSPGGDGVVGLRGRGLASRDRVARGDPLRLELAKQVVGLAAAVEDVVGVRDLARFEQLAVKVGALVPDAARDNLAKGAPLPVGDATGQLGQLRKEERLFMVGPPAGARLFPGRIEAGFSGKKKKKKNSGDCEFFLIFF